MSTESGVAAADAAATSAPAEAEPLDGRYALGEVIGRGGMADVHRGTDVVLLRPVAIKLLRDLTDPQRRDRFVDEARTLARLNHPGLITLLDAGIDRDRPYLVMELAEGDTLARRIAAGPLPDGEVRRVGQQLAEALDYAHRQGIVHRDVKPSNVLLGEDRAVLVDFGIARLVDAAEQHTRTGEAIGSPAYLAPEQVAAERITPAVDIFSLGLVLLEALTARRAYTGSPVEAAVARLNTAPPMPTSLAPGWRDLIARMTHRDPANRPTAAEVALALEALPDGVAPVVPPMPVPSELEATGELAVTMESPALIAAGAEAAPNPAPNPAPALVESRRRPRRAFAAVLGAVLLVACGVGAVAVHRATRSPAPVAEAAGSATAAVRVPAGVPDSLRPALLRLHRAATPALRSVPGLVRDLDRVDAALVDDRVAEARDALTAMTDAVAGARNDGRLSAVEAGRIERAAADLMALLPATSTATAPAGTDRANATPKPQAARPSAPAASTTPTPAAAATEAPAPEPSAPATTEPPAADPTPTPTAAATDAGAGAGASTETGTTAAS